MTDLHTALGQPAAWLGVPNRHSEEWEWVRGRLEQFTQLERCMEGRGPVWLWKKLQTASPPVHLTWGALLQGWEHADAGSVRDVILTQAPHADVRVWSWNARWLVDLHTLTAATKRRHIEQALMKGNIVCLQETHWHERDAQLWSHGLICRDVFHSAAGDSPFAGLEHDAGRFGGVATLLPPGYQFVQDECITLVPGHATLCCVLAPDGAKHQIVNCYLQTGHTAHTWDLLVAALPDGVIGHPNTLFIGDFNTDLPAAATRPIDDHGPHATLTQAGVVVAPDQPTCTSGDHPGTLDGIVIDAVVRDQWTIRAHNSNHSDHTAIYAVRSSCASLPTHAACTPARFWALPAEARMELRSDLAQVAQAMGVPHVCGPTPNDPGPAHPIPHQTDPSHPVHELLDPDTPATRANEAGPCDEEVAWMPLLANWGHACIQGAFHRWWRKWRTRGATADPCQAELCRLASRRGPDALVRQPVSETLGKWMEEVGGPADLNAHDAKHWLTVWINLSRAAAQAQLPRRYAGPTVDRDKPQRGVVAGRAIFRKRAALRTVKTPEGDEITDPIAISEKLLDTRRDIWFARPTHDIDGKTVLRAYMRGRRGTVPARPPLQLGPLRGAVLHPGGSGVGSDGIPYEAFHLHPQLVACLLGQGFLLLEARGQEIIATQADARLPQLLDAVLGKSLDLLIWIPKEPGNLLVTAQRPLSLPTCLRRLFGGAGMRLLGPNVEPGFDDGQASRAGGECQDNIQDAMHHVQTKMEPIEGQRLPHNRWACATLFGVLLPAVLTVCAAYQDDASEDIRWMAAVFLLDQAKAFEHLSHAWLRQVLTAWELPTWAEAFLISSAEGRRIVGHPRPEWPGETLLRGVGMGGPASMFTWCLAFDPVAWIAQIAAQCSNRTYVDDLMGKVFGPGQAMLLYLCLLAATRLADLKVEDHTCATLHGTRGQRCKELLGCFPLDIVIFDDDSFDIRAGPVVVYRKLLIATGLWIEDELTLTLRPCRCKTKHGLVPSAKHQEWADALVCTPLAAAVTHGTRSLGAHLVSCVAPADGDMDAPDNGETLVHSAHAIELCAAGTYKKSLSSTRDRVDETRRAGVSLHSRQAIWNMHCVSTIPYAATIIPAPDWVGEQLAQQMGLLFPTGNWARRDCLTDIGPLFQLKAYPRDPRIVALLTSIVTLGRKGLAGPEAGAGPANDGLARAIQWATATRSDGHSPGETRAERKAADLLYASITDRNDFGHGRGLGKALYTCIWTDTRKDSARDYLRQRSQERRWLPTNGHEWDALQHASAWSDAWVVARLYLNGLPGNARTRSRANLPPQRCHSCRTEGAFRWKWMSGNARGPEHQDAIGWCGACVSDRIYGCLPGEEPDEVAGASSDMLPGMRVPDRGLFKACPLCNTGEAGAEHIHIFCQPVRRAWQALRPDASDWRLTSGPDDAMDLKVRFNHAVGWLCCVLANSPVDRDEGYRLLCLQVLQRPRGWTVPQTLLPEDTEAHRQADTIDSWQWPGTRGPTASLCCSNGPNRTYTEYASHASDTRNADGRRPHPTLICAEVVRTGETVLELTTPTVPAMWPQIDRLTFGSPLPASQGAANISWSTTRCPHCRNFKLIGTACRDIDTDEALRADAAPWVLRRPSPRTLLISFDGGARRQHTDIDAPPIAEPVAGAGVALWDAPDTNGTRSCLAQLSLSTPRIHDSLAAEAAGMAHAISLFLTCLPDVEPVEILGDNLGVIRLGAGNARCRCDRVWQEVERSLMALAGQRWPTTWTAVRRCYNRTADALATIGVIRALHDHHRGRTQDHAYLWINRAVFEERGWTWPQTLSLHPSLELERVDQLVSPAGQ